MLVTRLRTALHYMYITLLLLPRIDYGQATSAAGSEADTLQLYFAITSITLGEHDVWAPPELDRIVLVQPESPIQVHVVEV